MSSYFRKVQGEPGIDAEGNDEEGLDGMDYKDEIKRFFVSHTIKDEHRLDGKVPGTCTVGRRDNDG
jgi:hypothetical protein